MMIKTLSVRTGNLAGCQDMFPLCICVDVIDILDSIYGKLCNLYVIFLVGDTKCMHLPTYTHTHTHTLTKHTHTAFM